MGILKHFVCSPGDKKILRELAKKQLEIANSPKNLERVELWKRHNALKAERPVIHIEVGTFRQDIIDPMMKCQTPYGRMIEYTLLQNFCNLELFDDDKVVAPYYMVDYLSEFELFDQKVKETVLKDKNGLELGHEFGYVIKDLHDDFDKIMNKSKSVVHKNITMRNKAILDDIFGDILPVKLVSNCLYAVPTQKVVHLMGMENMLFAMYDYPDEFKQMMDRIAEDYIAHFKMLENEGCLLQNHEFEGLAQGSMCFYDEAPKSGKILTTDVWGFLDSQETVGVSPDMFDEFIFPCYKKIGDIYGRLSYGCCEPVSAVWDSVKQFENLKKVSISPWCDEEFMASELKGSGIIYQRKPSPNYLGVGDTLDEAAFREHIDKTVKTARGCTLEITQRDVYTVNKDLNKVKRYVEIIRESIEENW